MAVSSQESGSAWGSSCCELAPSNIGIPGLTGKAAKPSQKAKSTVVVMPAVTKKDAPMGMVLVTLSSVKRLARLK